MSRDPVRAGSQFFGGRICLDFANTLDWRLTDDPVELIPDYAALLAWSARRGVLAERTTQLLKSRHQRHMTEGAAVIAAAHSLREQIWAVADALRAGVRADLRKLNRTLAGLPPQPALIEHAQHITFELDGTDLQQPLWPVLWSLTAVLASTDARRLGVCQARGCGWYFVDESPNHSRLWCSSEVCGNRERARRAYSRRRAD
ncbi:MAG TPA: CGNR zinc finger domain-containing protein [Steroidobacteraceae bacterium]|nr:CGNR zinc finger domain-containing protein [Steroidobacteraceae bacterium]